jgi:MFS transporter, DHA2 family, multidrug resistance protein
MNAPSAEMTRGEKLGFFFMVVGMFMAILDIQIVASSLPQIQAGISASADEITWVQTGYLVAEVVMIPLSGWLARVMSTRWLFATSAAGFTLFSAACALAWDPTSMIVFRAAQGFVGGAMIPSVFAAIFKLFPPDRRTGATVIVGLTATSAPAIGPTVGGYLTENLSWHWLFLVNLVPGILVAILVPLLINIDKPDWKLWRKTDIFSVLLVAGFLGCLEYVLDEGPRSDWFADPAILYLSLVSGLSAVLLVWRQFRLDHPLLELQAFANRNFTAGCALSFVVGMCLYGQSFILPQILSHIRGYNSLQVGQVMFLTGAAMFMTAPLAGQLSNRLDPRRVLLIGFLLAAGGLWLNSHMTVEVGFDQLFWPQVLRGAGLMLCIVPITTVAMGTLPVNLVSGGSGLYNVFRNMGGAVGMALIGTQFNDRFHTHYWRLAEDMSTTNTAVQDRLATLAQAMQATSDPDKAALLTLSHQATAQAAIMAWNDIFFLMAIAFVVAALLILALERPKVGAAAAAH